MRILTIDSSGLTASVSVTSESGLPAEFTISNKLTHSKTLLPMIKSMLALSEIPLESIDAIAVSAGPGSFTGLRIGASTAKALALSLDIPIIRVPTLYAMAFSLSLMNDGLVVPIMDARREEVYTLVMSEGLSLIDECAMSIKTLLSRLNNICDENEALNKAYFLGDGCEPYKDIILDEFKGEAVFASHPYKLQRAALAGELALNYFNKWLIDNNIEAKDLREGDLSLYRDKMGENIYYPDDFIPNYLRRPLAEVEKEEGLLPDPGEHSLEKLRQKKNAD